MLGFMSLILISLFSSIIHIVDAELSETNQKNFDLLHNLIEASHAEERRKQAATHVAFDCSHGDCSSDPSSPTWEKWHLSGNSQYYGRGMILTQDTSGQSGSIWMLHPYEMNNFDLEFRYRISGKNEYGADGMALWFTEGGLQDRFSVSPEEFGKRHAFGHSASWNGLGVFFDTFDNEGTGKGGLLGLGSKHPRVISIVNDGSFYWDHELEKIVDHDSNNRNEILSNDLLTKEAEIDQELKDDDEAEVKRRKPRRGRRRIFENINDDNNIDDDNDDKMISIETLSDRIGNYFEKENKEDIIKKIKLNKNENYSELSMTKSLTTTSTKTSLLQDEEHSTLLDTVASSDGDGGGGGEEASMSQDSITSQEGSRLHEQSQNDEEETSLSHSIKVLTQIKSKYH